ncbi:MAG: N-acetylmuramoyl-L-alanine amidase [Spirochaetaceae bacterium]|jgi:N-acetylmuramoyl-L-alanine amidase|nr:N-acetylmuramoyl-L-alanine amidase [Spirochaetaceae bacterium]
MKSQGWLCIILLIAASTSAFGQTQVPAQARILNQEETLSRLGATMRWDPFFCSGVLLSGDHYAVFEAGRPGESAPVLLDGRELLSLPVPYLNGGLLNFPEVFVASLKSAIDALNAADQDRLRIAAIIVDPGHGGRDAGAIGNHTIGGRSLRLMEKDVTLKTALELHRELSAAYPDKRVLLTRSGDTYPTLEERVALAHSVPLRDNEAVIFISIHANASFNKNARGYEVWYLSPEYKRDVLDKSRYDNMAVFSIENDLMQEEYTMESVIMARNILSRFDETIGRDSPSRGIKAEEWFVVRNARMPSVLVELGFVTNAEDAALLSSDAYLKKLSDALYKGIVDFIALFERSGGFTQVQ